MLLLLLDRDDAAARYMVSLISSGTADSSLSSRRFVREEDLKRPGISNRRLRSEELRMFISAGGAFSGLGNYMTCGVSKKYFDFRRGVTI